MPAFSQPSYTFRRASVAEAGLIQYLRFASLLCLEMPSQSLQSVRTLMGGLPDVDAALIESGHYHVADLGGELVGGGGWSVLPLGYRGQRLLEEDGEPGQLSLDNRTALLRGFFLDPDLGRRGVGQALLAHIEAEASGEGYRTLAIVGPASSQVYYRSLGFRMEKKLTLVLDGGETLPVLQMRKSLALRLVAAA